MENVFIDIRYAHEQIKRIFEGKDFISIEDMLNKISDLDDELDYVKESFEDYKREQNQSYEDGYAEYQIQSEIDRQAEDMFK